jgi:hypothetical protein
MKLSERRGRRSRRAYEDLVQMFRGVDCRVDEARRLREEGDPAGLQPDLRPY